MTRPDPGFATRRQDAMGSRTPFRSVGRELRADSSRGATRDPTAEGADMTDAPPTDAGQRRGGGSASALEIRPKGWPLGRFETRFPAPDQTRTPNWNGMLSIDS
ncbi:hypothetical protein GCM10009548_08270 [Streptomyces malaysiensis subsp. malaysiensis]